MKLTNESKTLFIPLYSKALMSKKGLLINDFKAEEIIKQIDFNFNKLKISKWLMMYMALRANCIDKYCQQFLNNHPNSLIIHLGCGLDARCLRLINNWQHFYDLDFKNVIDLRKQFYQENSQYTMIGKSINDLSWLDEIKSDCSNVLIVAEGLMMYLSENEINNLLKAINIRFKQVIIIFDSYATLATKLSKIKNPVNQMQAVIKWGMNDPDDLLKLNQNLQFVSKFAINDKNNNLKGISKVIFNHLYCGKLANKLYQIYVFKLQK